MKNNTEVFMPKASIELRRTWEERIQNQRSSGLSIQRWCLENQIAPHLFHYWRGRIFPKTISRGCFIEIAGAKDVGITIEVAGVCVRLEKHFDALTLKRCLETLKSC
jgi:hypothetical protein